MKKQKNAFDPESIKAQVDSSTGCLLAYIPATNPEDVEVVVGCADDDLEYLVLGVLGAIGQRLLGNEETAASSKRENDRAISTGLEAVRKMTRVYLGGKTLH